MCEFCLKHGEGQKWYLQAKNYSDDLLSDIRRHRFIEEFFTNTKALERDTQRIDKLEKAPRFIRSTVSRTITRRMKKVHYGQIVPIEDIERIFGFVNSIVRVACLCRHITLGKERRYCYGISLAPGGGKLAEIFRRLDKSFFNGPDTAGLETLSKDEAISAFRRLDKSFFNGPDTAQPDWKRSAKTRLSLPSVVMNKKVSATAYGPSILPSSEECVTATARTAWPCDSP